MNEMTKKSKHKKVQHKHLENNDAVSNLPLVKKRNAVALNPLMKKSTVHEKSTKAKRQAAKVNLKKTWFERVVVLAATGQSHVLLPAL